MPGVFHAKVNDVLLSGLAVAVGAWRRRRGAAAGPVLVDLEGHGREEIDPGADLARTVGVVHQPVPGAARPGPARLGRRAGGRPRAEPRGEADQGSS
ncbi:hypothetical protein LT493_25715 [Streptomyces tricolor]|nr:hypothetical protein [Streptomyces tricolor]